MFGLLSTLNAWNPSFIVKEIERATIAGVLRVNEVALAQNPRRPASCHRTRERPVCEDRQICRFAVVTGIPSRQHKKNVDRESNRVLDDTGPPLNPHRRRGGVNAVAGDDPATRPQIELNRAFADAAGSSQPAG